MIKEILKSIGMAILFALAFFGLHSILLYNKKNNECSLKREPILICREYLSGKWLCENISVQSIEDKDEKEIEKK